MSYESPIMFITEQMTTELHKQVEDNLYNIIQRYNISVNREELIKALKYDREQYELGFQDGLHKDKWVKVKDGMPDEGEEVLIYCPEFLEEIRKAFYTEGDFYVDKEDLIIKPAPNGYCTHWQPLPKPPKGE
jgi:protoheme ferro-lyase